MRKYGLVNFLSAYSLLFILNSLPCSAQLLSSLQKSSVCDEGKVVSVPVHKEKNREIRHAFSKVLGPKEPLLRYLQWLFLEQGLSFPSTLYPITLEEVRYLMCTYLDKNTLSKSARQLYDLVWEKTEQISSWGKAGALAIDPVLGVNGEFYIGCMAKNSRDWYLHSYTDRPGFIKLGAEVSLLDRLYINTTAHISQDPIWIDLNPNSFSGNIITNFSSIYALMPQEAYVSFYAPHFNAQGGRGYLQWGNGYSGNLLLSRSSEELDYLQVSTWWKFVRFSSLWVFLDYSLPMRDKQTGQIIYYQAGSKRYAYAIAPEELKRLEGQPSQFFLAHRLDFKLGKSMDLSISEALIYKDYWKNLAFLNPLYLFSNWHLNARSHYCFCLETQVVFCPSWKLYAQFLIERLANPWSLKKNDEASLPFLIGLEMSKSLGTGHLSWVFECVKIDPYSYVGKEGVGFYFDKRWLSSYAGAHSGLNGYTLLRRIPLGYSLGNDLIRFFTFMRYEVPDLYSFWLQYSHSFKRENGSFSINLKDSSYLNDTSTNVFTQMLLSVGGEIRLTPYLKGINLSLKTDVTLGASFVERYTHWDVQVGLGINYWY